jgi:hypothetical protein
MSQGGRKAEEDEQNLLSGDPPELEASKEQN